MLALNLEEAKLLAMVLDGQPLGDTPLAALATKANAYINDHELDADLTVLLQRAVNLKLSAWDNMTAIEKALGIDDNDQFNNALVDFIDILAAGAPTNGHYAAEPEHIETLKNLPGAK